MPGVVSVKPILPGQGDGLGVLPRALPALFSIILFFLSEDVWSGV